MTFETFGWIGSILFAICGLPQVIKTWRTKKTDDLSLMFIWMWLLGEVFTLMYIAYNDVMANQYHVPLYVNYFGNLLMAFYLLYAKYRYTEKKIAVQQS
ncbi:PQ-loop repeat-containing protein [Puteibacter caeruleilacunae]|nr:PQ-loop repeat-containing protein [Puteibacter caeruleilacunae]